MVNLSSMKEYFSILLSGDNKVQSKHPFAEDERRFFLFKRVRNDFHKMHIQMDTLAHLLKSSCPEYEKLMVTLKKHFSELSRLSDADFDYYLRTLAVEKCIHTKTNGEADVPDMLNNLLQGVVQLFVADGDKVQELIEDALKNLHEKHRKKPFFESRASKLLRESLQESSNIYEQIEHDLSLAKEGIIAKDKRMLELLQKLKIGIGDALIQAAIENTNIRMPDKNVLSFTEALKRNAAKKQKELQAQIEGSQLLRGI